MSTGMFPRRRFAPGAPPFWKASWLAIACTSPTGAGLGLKPERGKTSAVRSRTFDKPDLMTEPDVDDRAAAGPAAERGRRVRWQRATGNATTRSTAFD